MSTQPNTSHLLNSVSSSLPSPNTLSVQHPGMLSVEQSLSLAKHTGEAPQMNSLEDVLNLTGINEHPPAGTAKGLQPTSAPQTTKPPSSSTLSALSNLSPSLLAAATGRSLGYNFALSGAANVLAYTSVHQNGQGPVSLLATPASTSQHHPSPLLTSLGVGERGPRSSTIPPISVSTPNILKSHKAPVSSSTHLGSLAGKTGTPAVSSGISKAAGLSPMSWTGGNPQSVSSVMSPLVGNPPQSQVTSWKWSSSPYQGSLGGKRPPSSVGVEELPANKKMVTTKAPENSAEVAALNIKQSLILELQRTQVTLKQLELVQRQYLLQRKVKEARDVEQKINLLLQRQRQVIHTIQTASWDGNLKKSGATVTESIGLGTSPLHTTPVSSSIIKLGGVTPYVGAATSQVGVATSQVGGASFQSGHPIPPIPSLLASPPPTVGQTSHASTTSSLSSTSLSSTILPRALPLLVHGHTAAPPTSTSTPPHSSPVVSSPSFVAVSSAFTYQPSTSLPSNQSLLATTTPKSSHSVPSAPSGQSSAVTSPFTFTASTVGAHTSGLAPISAATSVTQAPGNVPKVAGTSSSAHQPSPSQNDSDNVITAQETLVLLKNPALQEKLTMEKLQHLNSIRLQALNDYQRQRIQAFVAGLPPHEVPKDITELKKILQEKGFQIQVPVYLAAQAIPRLYAQELMRVSAVIGASAGSTSMVRLEEGQVTPSSSAHVEQHHRQQQGSTPSSSLLPIPSLLGQSATLSLSPANKGAVGEKSEPLSTKGVHPPSLHHALSVTPPEAALAQQQQAQASHPWTDVQQRLKGIIAHMEQQQQSQTLSSLSGGSQGPQDWRAARTGYSLMENLSSNSSYMTRAQAKAKQLAELRAQQQRQRSLNTQEAYVTSHMKAIVRRDHELLGDRAGDERPFSSVEDAVKRLLPYHIYHEEDTPPEMEKKFDLLHRNICSLLVSRQNGIMAKYHRLMLKEAEKEVSTGLEVCALREFVDGETPPTPTPPPEPPLLSTWPPLDPFNTTISGLQPSLQASSSSWTPLSLANFTPTGKMF